MRASVSVKVQLTVSTDTTEGKMMNGEKRESEVVQQVTW